LSLDFEYISDETKKDKFTTLQFDYNEVKFEETDHILLTIKPKIEQNQNDSLKTIIPSSSNLEDSSEYKLNIMIEQIRMAHSNIDLALAKIKFTVFPYKKM
jgi:hypothetical protein